MTVKVARVVGGEHGQVVDVTTVVLMTVIRLENMSEGARDGQETCSIMVV